MVKTFAVIKIKNGFINSIGWNLKKYKSSHRLDPLTSIPINGTSTNKIREIMKIGIKVFFKKLISIIDKKNITNKDKKTKIKCL